MLAQHTLDNLHAELKRALAEGTAAFSPHAKFRSVWRHSDSMSDDPYFLEVLIMAGLFARARPSPMRQAFRKLRRLRVAAGELERFEALEEILEVNKQGYFLNNHGYSKERLSDLKPDDVFAGLARHINILEDVGYKSFANSGTLLGLVREGGLIKYDDDADLCVILQADSHEAAAEEFLSLGQTLTGKAQRRPLRNVHHGMLKMNEIVGLDIDLFPAYCVDGRIFIYPYSFGDLAEEHVLPLKTCPFSGLPVPNHADAVLEVNYGEDWRTPIRLFDFPWAQQRKKFERFLSGLA